MIWILLIILLIFYFRPWIDIYTDYKEIKHIVLWYTNFKGKRMFINLIGSQK